MTKDLVVVVVVGVTEDIALMINGTPSAASGYLSIHMGKVSPH